MMKITLGSATCARLLFSVAVLWAASAYADLQNVQVGGKIEIYGAWYSGFWEPNDAVERIPASHLLGRSLGPYGTSSFIRGGSGNSLAFLEQRTQLEVKADLTDNVAAFVEFDSIDTWGEDFRSNYLTGIDSRADTSDDIGLFQAYLEFGNVFGQPLRIRVGRQALEFGASWLLGAEIGPDPFIDVSFDGVRLTYEWDNITIDAWWSKLAERSPLETDGDVDFYGVYATLTESEGKAATEPLKLQEASFPAHLIYHGFRHSTSLGGGGPDAADEVSFDMYWMYVRDAAGRHDTMGGPALERFERRAGLDDYEVTNLHTAGTRFAGQLNAFDWDLEAAYQWGNADALGSLFVPVGGVYGDNKARWDTWAGHGEVGYTLGGKFSPRIFLCAAYYDGEDNRNVSFGDWLNPYRRGNASVSFNRLFSTLFEDWFIDATGMSNFWKASLGASIKATESLEFEVSVIYLAAVSPFDYPVMPGLPFITEKGDKDLGWQVTFDCTYSYSDDLSFEVGYAHFFLGDAITDGVVFTDDFGLRNIGAADDDGADFAYFLTTLEF